MENIDIIETLERNKLIFKSHWLEYYEVFLLSIFLTVLVLIMIYLTSNDLWSKVIISFIILMLLGFSIYKNRKCRQLVSIETGFIKEKNKSLVIDLLSKKNYKMKFHNENYFRLISNYNFLLMRHELTIIFNENKILFNLFNSTGLVRLPSYLTLNLLIRELKIHFNK